jgi:hypothetical protein
VRANLIAALIGMLCVVGCGGGGSSVGGGGGGTPSGANVQPVTVDSGPSPVATSNSPAVNTLYTTVRVCVPGTSTCQDIDHIQVDTGSSGLRIITTALTLSLPLQKDSNGNVVAECTQFVDGSSWGPFRLADIKISGEIASNQAVQIIYDPAYPIQKAYACGTGTAPANPVQAFGANGILGVGPFLQDCGSSCVQGGGVYYTCTSGTTCTTGGMPLALQITNPVAAFATDNNGVLIQLGAVGGTASSVSGSLIFGIGTQGNNGLGNAKVFTFNQSGNLSTTYKNTSLSRGFIDSGSNAYYFTDATIHVCGSSGETTKAPGFFCPSGTLNLSATIMGGNGTSSAINFNVTNADSLFGTGTVIAAASDLAGSSASITTASLNGAFDWGLPFYFGRSVYTAIENQNTSAGLGPYFAF